jgi:hypothetical protein
MNRRQALALALFLPLAGCGEDPNAPYFAFGGGGFVYNYRIGEVYYGFVAQPRRKLPANAELVARFENPAGGPEIEVRAPIEAGKTQYMFRTPPVKGVIKDRPYAVSLSLQDEATGREISRIARTFTSTADPALMPSGPLVVGPGYAPNPNLTGPYAPKP